MIWGKYGLVCFDSGFGGSVANFYRIILACAMIFLSFPTCAGGNVYVSGTWYASVPGCGGDKQFISFAQLSTCVNTVYPTEAPVKLAPGYEADYLQGVRGSYFQYGVSEVFCPTNSTNSTLLPTRLCVCKTGFTADATGSQCEADVVPCTPPEVRNAAGVCESPCVAKKGQILSSGKYDWGTNPEVSVVSVCDGACDAIFEGSQAAARFLDNGKYHYLAQGQYIYSGFACTGATEKPALTGVPSDTCAVGQIMGQVNGKNICVSNSTGESQDPHQSIPKTIGTTSTSASNPDGSTTTTTTTTNHEDGSTTTTSKTVQPNGDTTVTGTTTPPEGIDPLDGFCKQNPEAPLCSEKESKFAGSCAGAFTCEGDAIQCALASEIHKRNCTMFEEKTSLSELGDSLGQGTDSGVSTNPANSENRESITLPSSLSMGGAITARCMSDRSVQVMSTTLTIPFSTICPYLEIMGKIVVAMSLLVAARIIGGGIA